MRRSYVLCLIVFLSGFAHRANAEQTAHDAAVTVAFGSGCETLLVDALQGATSSVSIAIYSLTDKPIYTAIGEAAARGVSVLLKYDVASAQAYAPMQDAITYLKKKGISCTPIDMKDDAKMHDKFTVIDGARVLTGSYNYTVQATHQNYENLVLIDSKAVAKRFLIEFKRIR